MTVREVDQHTTAGMPSLDAETKAGWPLDDRGPQLVDKPAHRRYILRGEPRERMDVVPRRQQRHNMRQWHGRPVQPAYPIHRIHRHRCESRHVPEMSRRAILCMLAAPTRSPDEPQLVPHPKSNHVPLRRDHRRQRRAL